LVCRLERNPSLLWGDTRSSEEKLMLTYLFKLIWFIERMMVEKDTLYVSRATVNRYKMGRSNDAPYL
jgi:hypothetical protein